MFPRKLVAVRELADLRDDRRRPVDVRRDVHVAVHDRQPEEHDAEQRSHDHERLAGVLPCGLAERRNAVRDRLDAGHRGAARRERVQHERDRSAHEEEIGLAARAEVHDAGHAVIVGLREPAVERLEHADTDQDRHVDDEEVRGDCEELPRLLHATQVPPGDDHDEQDRDRQDPRREHAERRCECGGAGGNRHRHGEHVVGEERDAGHLRGQEPEVVACHHVRATGGGVRLDRLPVRKDQEQQHREERDRDRHDEREGREPDDRHEHAQHLFGGVRRRREVVGSEHGEGGRLAQTLVLELLGVERRAEELVLQPVTQAVGRQLDAGLDRRGERVRSDGVRGTGFRARPRILRSAPCAPFRPVSVSVSERARKKLRPRSFSQSRRQRDIRIGRTGIKNL